MANSEPGDVRLLEELNRYKQWRENECHIPNTYHALIPGKRPGPWFTQWQHDKEKSSDFRIVKDSRSSKRPSDFDAHLVKALAELDAIDDGRKIGVEDMNDSIREALYGKLDEDELDEISAIRLTPDVLLQVVFTPERKTGFDYEPNFLACQLIYQLAARLLPLEPLEEVILKAKVDPKAPFENCFKALIDISPVKSTIYVVIYGISLCEDEQGLKTAVEMLWAASEYVKARNEWGDKYDAWVAEDDEEKRKLLKAERLEELSGKADGEATEWRTRPLLRVLFAGPGAEKASDWIPKSEHHDVVVTI
ncbi:hypothetical protein BU26DRAFT_560527 [Trematosphaeria pertusa]|uniref:Uncharacterized protein n=1 Tax=Trematosphaeria pertusa TaxID=390896 RepID=A0A6A6IUC9_9PLEO|nr:uncharacterized protein BU26DRAFT_560527 [Trematosphaeria pertusa]KAF2253200.1 hypothetical protein BU26DRAFT_560527 [Trematosphaeria pertusa]